MPVDFIKEYEGFTKYRTEKEKEQRLIYQAGKGLLKTILKTIPGNMKDISEQAVDAALTAAVTTRKSYISMGDKDSQQAAQNRLDIIQAIIDLDSSKSLSYKHKTAPSSQAINDAFEEAITTGQWDVIKLIIRSSRANQLNKTIVDKAATAAADNKQWEVLKNIFSLPPQSQPTNAALDKVVAEIVDKKNWEMVKWLFNLDKNNAFHKFIKKYPLAIDYMLNLATKAGELSVVKWLCESQKEKITPFTIDALYKLAKKEKHADIAQYLSFEQKCFGIRDFHPLVRVEVLLEDYVHKKPLHGFFMKSDHQIKRILADIKQLRQNVQANKIDAQKVEDKAEAIFSSLRNLDTKDKELISRIDYLMEYGKEYLGTKVEQAEESTMKPE